MLPEDMNVLVFKYVVNKDEAHNPKVVGSNPSSATKKTAYFRRFFLFL